MSAIMIVHPDIAQVFSSSSLYKQAFADGLSDILDSQTAGTFILACANILQHPELITKFQKSLAEIYADIAEYYLSCEQAGEEPGDAPDDVVVMNKLIQIGLENLEPVQYRYLEVGGATFLLNYNQVRSFRPARMSGAKEVSLDVAFNPDGFHFDKPFLEKEIFAKGELHGRDVSLLYNKFPFVEYHALLVIDKARHLQQYLVLDYLEYVMQLLAEASDCMPDLVIAYNSLGGGASVNHLHFQVYLETQPLAIFAEDLKHNGGSQIYPARCHVFSEVNAAWDFVSALHSNNIAYNLIMRDQQIYCLPRKNSDTDFSEINITTYGWSDMAGAFNLHDKEVFQSVSVDRLMETIHAVSKDV